MYININLLKVEIFECEMCLNNSSGFNSCPQNILLRWQVIFGAQTFQGIQITTKINKYRIKIFGETNLPLAACSSQGKLFKIRFHNQSSKILRLTLPINN